MIAVPILAASSRQSSTAGTCERFSRPGKKITQTFKKKKIIIKNTQTTSAHLDGVRNLLSPLRKRVGSSASIRKHKPDKARQKPNKNIKKQTITKLFSP
jgi:hypothetical protein